MRENPFTPSFGTLPPVLVGRSEVLAALAPMFDRFRKNDIHWATHLRGHRGAGKTVLLDQIQDAATQAGWWVLQEDAGAGQPLTRRLIDRSLTRLAEHAPPRRGRRITSVSVLGAGITLEPGAPVPASVTSVRDVLEALVRAEPNGVLVTVDEVHQAPDSALGEIGNAAQHLHRDGLPLAFVLAGLPRSGRSKEPTFLSRAWQPDLGPLPDEEIERGFVATASIGGASFEPLALRRAVEIAEGQPFLMQLVGYHAWERARRSQIATDDVLAAAGVAIGMFNQAVTTQMVGDLAPDLRRFLASMVHLGTPTRLGDIRAANGWDSSQGGVYRARLIDVGLVRPSGHGYVEFAVPGVPDVLDPDGSARPDQ